MLSATRVSETQQIWSDFAHRLRGFIVGRVESDADADDILQDVFLRIHLHADSVQRSERLVSWLYQVTRNAIADYYRAPERRRVLLSGSAHELDQRPHGAIGEIDDSGVASASAWRELATCLTPMVGRLAPLYRDAVTLIDLQGLPQQEAADRAGISLSGMKSRVQRGRRELKRLMHDCCHFDLDAGGRVSDYQSRGLGCEPCGTDGGCSGDG